MLDTQLYNMYSNINEGDTQYQWDTWNIGPYGTYDGKQKAPSQMGTLSSKRRQQVTESRDSECAGWDAVYREGLKRAHAAQTKGVLLLGWLEQSSQPRQETLETVVRE